VRRDLKRDYAEADLAAAGLSVYTSLDLRARGRRSARSPRTAAARLEVAGPRRASGGRPLTRGRAEQRRRVAVVGGREVDTNVSIARSIARPPIGSLVKPRLYLTALETGRYTAATLIEDAPIEFEALPMAASGRRRTSSVRFMVRCRWRVRSRVDEPGDGAPGIGPGPAKVAATLERRRARIVADATNVAPARHRGDVALECPGVHDTRRTAASHPAGGGAAPCWTSTASRSLKVAGRGAAPPPPCISSTACSCSCRLTARPRGGWRGYRKVW